MTTEIDDRQGVIADLYIVNVFGELGRFHRRQLQLTAPTIYVLQQAVLTASPGERGDRDFERLCRAGNRDCGETHGARGLFFPPFGNLPLGLVVAADLDLFEEARDVFLVSVDIGNRADKFEEVGLVTNRQDGSEHAIGDFAGFGSGGGCLRNRLFFFGRRVGANLLGFAAADDCD